MAHEFVHLDKKSRHRAMKIGRAAARLFSRKGYVETTMDGVAAAARISKGGLYHYFPSKAEILYYILTNYMDLVLLDLEQDLSQIAGSEEKIKFIISRHIHLYTRQQNEAKVLLHEAHCLPAKYFEVIAQKERKYFQIVTDVLSEFFCGTLPRGQLTATTFLLFGMCNWIYAWYSPKGTVSPEELSAMCWRLFLTGVNGMVPETAR